jgi:hypothetical protein
VKSRVDKVYDKLWYYGYNKDDASRLSKQIVRSLDRYANLMEQAQQRRIDESTMRAQPRAMVYDLARRGGEKI